MNVMKEKPRHNNRNKGTTTKSGDYLPFSNNNIRFLVPHFELNQDYISSSKDSVLDPE